MADNTKERGPQDRARVNVSQDHELDWWSRKFGVSQDELRKAVRDVGTSVEAVGRKLGRSPAR